MPLRRTLSLPVTPDKSSSTTNVNKRNKKSPNINKRASRVGVTNFINVIKNLHPGESINYFPITKEILQEYIDSKRKAFIKASSLEQYLQHIQAYNIALGYGWDGRVFGPIARKALSELRAYEDQLSLRSEQPTLVSSQIFQPQQSNPLDSNSITSSPIQDCQIPHIDISGSSYVFSSNDSIRSFYPQDNVSNLNQELPNANIHHHPFSNSYRCPQDDLDLNLIDSQQLQQLNSFSNSNFAISLPATLGHEIAQFQTDIRDYPQDEVPSIEFFYNPPNDLRIYAISCKEIPSFDILCELYSSSNNGSIQNRVQSSDLHEFHFLKYDEKKCYKVTCKLITTQYLNQKIHGIESDEQENVEFPGKLEENLEHLWNSCCLMMV